MLRLGHKAEQCKPNQFFFTGQSNRAASFEIEYFLLIYLIYICISAIHSCIGEYMEDFTDST